MKNNKLCFNCLKYGHLVRGCMQKSNCIVTGCNSKHHTLFHTYRNTKDPCDSLNTKNDKRNDSDNVEPQSLSKNTYATVA